MNEKTFNYIEDVRTYTSEEEFEWSTIIFDFVSPFPPPDSSFYLPPSIYTLN